MPNHPDARSPSVPHQHICNAQRQSHETPEFYKTSNRTKSDPQPAKMHPCAECYPKHNDVKALPSISWNEDVHHLPVTVEQRIQIICASTWTQVRKARSGPYTWVLSHQQPLCKEKVWKCKRTDKWNQGPREYSNGAENCTFQLVIKTSWRK